MLLPGTTIEYMTAMTLLHSHENRLQELPWELGEMQQLTDFSYYANELNRTTPEILSIGAIDLIDYMKTVNKSKKTKKLALTRMSSVDLSRRRQPRRGGVLSINMDSDEAYTHMDDFYLTLHQKLGGGFSTPCPLFCLICTISSGLNGQMNLYQNTPQVLAARSFIIAGFNTR